MGQRLVDAQGEHHFQHILARDIVGAAEGRHHHRLQEHVLEQRDAQRVQHAQHPPGQLPVGQGGFIGQQIEQAVQLHRIHAQAGGEAAIDPGAIIAGQVLGQREAAGRNGLLVAAIGAAGPIGAVEQLAIGGHGLDRGQRVGGAHQPHHLAPALAAAKQLGQFLDIAIGGGAKAGDDVHRIAQLLQDGIVGNGADLAQAHGAVGGKVALAAAFAAAGVVQQPQAKGGERPAVGAAGQMVLLHPANGAIEIEAEVGAAIEWIGRRIGVGFGQRRLGKTGEGGQRQFRRAEEQIAIAALKAHLRLQPQPGADEASPRPGT